MIKKIIADVTPNEVRVALTEDGNLAELQVEIRGRERLVGNIYKGRVANILPGMQAAFIDVGLEKNAFLYAGDILCDEQDFEFEDQEESAQIKKKFEPPNIKDILKPGQEIMVQVLKQPGGAKGARVTTHVTLPGRLLVLMPTVDHVGVSRRIKDESLRERLKELGARFKPEGMGIILRTAAGDATEEEISSELRFYTRLWDKICNKASLLNAPRLIHAEENLLFRTARDLYTDDVCEFIINDREYYNKISALVNIISPSMSSRLKLYEGEKNLFDAYNLEEKINKALLRKVWLKNGCYLVIDETEALTAIDVNTGKYIGEDNFQDTILNANLEAAEEIARQLRLRDISGIIVIDFIDMDNSKNKQLVVKRLEEALSNDRTKSNVLGMTELGLVEMTRKKMRRRLSALTQRVCPVCGGSGKILNLDTLAGKLRREITRAMGVNPADVYLAEVSPELEEYITAKNSRDIALLPAYEGIRFYMRSLKGSEPSYMQIIKQPKKDELRGAQAFY